MKQILNLDGVCVAGPYSVAVKSGGLIFLSGQIAPDAKGENLYEAQTDKILSNMEDILESLGLSLKNVIKTTIFVTEMNEFSNLNRVYGKYFSDQPPARSCVEVSSLPKGALVEIDAIISCD